MLHRPSHSALPTPLLDPQEVCTCAYLLHDRQRGKNIALMVETPQGARSLALWPFCPNPSLWRTRLLHAPRGLGAFGLAVHITSQFPGFSLLPELCDMDGRSPGHILRTLAHVYLTEQQVPLVSSPAPEPALSSPA